jgi:putative ABC transport system permease protein
MDRTFIVKLAYRNLRLHRLRTLLTLTGVIIGTSAIVFLVSFAFGLERLVTNEITSGDAFSLIDVGTGNSQIITLTDSTATNIKNISGVKDVYGTTSVGAKSVIDNRTMDVSFYGTSAGYMDKAGIKVTKGGTLSGSEDEVLVNTSLLKYWGVSAADILGRKVVFDLVIPKNITGNPDNVEYDNQSYVVKGVVDDTSSPKAYSSSSNLRRFGVSSYDLFKVEVKSKSNVSGIRTQIEDMGLKTQYVGDTVSQINQVFSIFRLVLGAFGLITLAVAMLGMFNTLTISLLERIKEVALMKMLGMSKKDVRSVFLAESIMLGLSGGVLGLLFGVSVGKLANAVLNHYAKSMGGETVSIFYSPVSFIVTIIIVSALIGFLTGLYPARRAAKVDSLDVLRYE